MAFHIPRAETMIPSLFASGTALVATTAFKGACALVKWWMKNPMEEAAQKVIDALDESDTGVEAGAEMMTIAGKMVPVVRRRIRRVAANSYALQAYLKFGKRPKSEANIIITRKYISDLLAEVPDMRIRDKIEIMDTATFLSFIPSKSSQECGAYESTNAYARRMVGEWRDL